MGQREFMCSLRQIFRVFIIFLLTIIFTHQILADNRTDFPAQIQFILGELPHNDFAPGISFGYHLNDLIYLGYILQFPFEIGGDNGSINAQAPGFDGLVNSKAKLGKRQALQIKLSPFEFGAFISLGALFIDADKERIDFDKRVRTIGSNSYDAAVKIELERPPAVRSAAGLGFNHVFSNGVSMSAEAFFALGDIPNPRISITSDTPIAASDKEALVRRISEKFTDNIHNRYHLVQIGIGFNF